LGTTGAETSFAGTVGGTLSVGATAAVGEPFESAAGSVPFDEAIASLTSPFESTIAGGTPASLDFIVLGDFTTAAVSLVLGASSSTTGGFSLGLDASVAVGTNDPTTARASLPASANALFNSA